MAKVMLVEDDNNLREIYEARLQAEGYDIISAKDGEEALAKAVKERPDLIIADIMMPKISGFDMLDILRGTPETKDTKVIMMTALSQSEDKARATKLGADRYLVKSQVTLEDVARVAKETLEGKTGDETPAAAPATPAVASETPAPIAATPPAPVPTPAPVPISTPTPQVDPTPAAPVTPAPPADTPIASPPPSPVPPATTPTPVSVQVSPAPTTSTTVASEASSADPKVAPEPQVIEPTNADSKHSLIIQHEDQSSGNNSSQTINTQQPTASAITAASEDEQPKTSVHTKVIKPLNDITKPGADFAALIASEQAKETSAQPTPAPVTVTVTSGAAPIASPVPQVPQDVNRVIVNDIKPSGVKSTGASVPAQTIQPQNPVDPSKLGL